MKNAITKAIEGGYRGGMIGESKDGFWGAEEFINSGANINDLFLDPLFWQCLGKALGWKDEKVFVPEYAVRGGLTVGGGITYKQEAWLYHWHRFIDHLAEGKDVDTFFKDLLSKGRE